MSAPGRLLALPATLLALADAYLLLLLAAAAAAARRRRPPPPAGGEPPAFTVLVPAHDEERVLPATLASLAALDYPADRVRVVVIADNCGDRTAAVARAAGADVLERDEPDRPGKGQALAWALEGLAGGPVAIVDADCTVSPNLLAAFANRFAAGAPAVQADYVVANPGESSAAALRFAAFSLVNSVRPAGRDALGLSCGLLGTGMAFTPELLRRVPWRDFGLAEDLEYGLRLVAAGERVVFAPEAKVRSPMPASAAASRQQQLRWEGGKWAAARRWSAPLLRGGLRRRDPAPIAAAAELLVPPQSLLAAAHVGLLGAARLTGARTARRQALAGAAAQAAYVLGGLALVRAPASLWRALPRAPLLVLAKLPLLARVLAGRAPERWVRTPRESSQSSS